MFGRHFEFGSTWNVWVCICEKLVLFSSFSFDVIFFSSSSSSLDIWVCVRKRKRCTVIRKILKKVKFSLLLLKIKRREVFLLNKKCWKKILANVTRNDEKSLVKKKKKKEGFRLRFDVFQNVIFLNHEWWTVPFFLIKRIFFRGGGEKKIIFHMTQQNDKQWFVLSKLGSVQKELLSLDVDCQGIEDVVRNFYYFFFFSWFVDKFFFICPQRVGGEKVHEGIARISNWFY